MVKEELTEKQKKIIEAAIEIFAEKGYASSSTSEIAKRAGVAEGTIFRHYRTKKDLLLNIVAPIMKKVIAPFAIQGFEDIFDKNYETFGDFLRAMILNRMGFVEKHRTIIKIIIQEVPFHPELRSQMIDLIGKKVYSRFSQMIIHFQEKGEIKNIPVQTIARHVISTLAGYVMTTQILFPIMSDEEKTREMEETIVFIVRGIKP